jgi:hypothetical protein
MGRRKRSAVLHKRSVTRAWQVAATNFATFGWLEPHISEEIPFGNGTKQCEQSGGEEEPFVVVLYFGSLKTPQWPMSVTM